MDLAPKQGNLFVLKTPLNVQQRLTSTPKSVYEVLKVVNEANFQNLWTEVEERTKRNSLHVKKDFQVLTCQKILATSSSIMVAHVKNFQFIIIESPCRINEPRFFPILQSFNERLSEILDKMYNCRVITYCDSPKMSSKSRDENSREC